MTSTLDPALVFPTLWAVELLTQNQKRVEYRGYPREQRAAVYEDTFENPYFSFSVFVLESHVDQYSRILSK